MFYLVSSIILSVIVLVVSFAQAGSTCTWLFLFNPTTSPLVVLLQMTFLGIVIGALLVLFWKSGEKELAEGDDAE